MKKTLSKALQNYSWFFIVLILIFLLVPITYLANQSSSTKPQVPAQALSHHDYMQQKNKLISRLNEKGAKASFSYLREAIGQNASLARDCHPLLHELGHEAYDKLNGFESAAATYDELCNSGYLHGLIESHFLASNNITATLQSTCNKERLNTFKQWQCFHGIGHGAMYFTNKNLNDSIKICKNLTNDFALGSCVNGVFMERFIVVSHSGVHAKNSAYIDQTLCKSQPAEYKYDCYFYSPTAYLTLNSNDYKGAAKMCKKVEADFIETCIKGVGSQVMKENITRPVIAREFCSGLRRKYETSCVWGAVSLFINHHASTNPASELCKSTFKKYEATCNLAVKDKQVYLKI